MSPPCPPDKAWPHLSECWISGWCHQHTKYVCDHRSFVFFAWWPWHAKRRAGTLKINNSLCPHEGSQTSLPSRVVRAANQSSRFTAVSSSTSDLDGDRSLATELLCSIDRLYPQVDLHSIRSGCADTILRITTLYLRPHFLHSYHPRQDTKVVSRHISHYLLPLFTFHHHANCSCFLQPQLHDSCPYPRSGRTRRANSVAHLLSPRQHWRCLDVASALLNSAWK
jgi:hypothetical protein